MKPAQQGHLADTDHNRAVPSCILINVRFTNTPIGSKAVVVSSEDLHTRDLQRCTDPGRSPAHIHHHSQSIIHTSSTSYGGQPTQPSPLGQSLINRCNSSSRSRRRRRCCPCLSPCLPSRLISRHFQNPGSHSLGCAASCPQLHPFLPSFLPTRNNTSYSGVPETPFRSHILHLRYWH